ncbi:hypothetical protein [Lactiplantibacillus daowaiensis]|uniref:Integral membrane protein n=1 Tax=Lactiplantibacillus daowaiensis TaxID=2559918 RepID=A0ABW1S420_9LACO|nr:hypothetical protein [Lactiplantibacillus daowaiensis]
MPPKSVWWLQSGGIILSAGVVLLLFGGASWPLAAMLLTALPLNWGALQLSQHYSQATLVRFLWWLGLIAILDLVLGLIWFKALHG